MFYISITIFAIGILIVMYNVDSDNSRSIAYASLSAVIVSLVAFMLNYTESERKEKTDCNNILCHYSERYSTDANIKRVVSWMLRNMNDNGSLKIDRYRTTIGEPNLYQKEMFMRFFEEVKVQMDNGKLSHKDVKRLFSYYALKFNDYHFFRKGIVDYKTSEDWEDFRQFIIEMGGKIPNDENL